MSIELAKEVLKIEAEGILSLIEQLGQEFDNAVSLIMQCPTRVIISGIGKSGIIGQKIAATLNSTGTTSFFLHPVEAMHGDLGIVDPRDVLLAISYSGNTVELDQLVSSLKKRGTKIIALTGNKESRLGALADVVIEVMVPREACPLGLAPTASTTAALAMGDALAVVLLQKKQFKESDFRRNHPGGSLGERLKVNVSEIMLTGDKIPLVNDNVPVLAAISVLNQKNLGAVLVVNDSMQLVGILTDGDVRRLVTVGHNFTTLKICDVMSKKPKSIDKNLLAADAVSIMQRYEVTVLPVTENDGMPVGFLHLQDLLGKGEFRFLL